MNISKILASLLMGLTLCGCSLFEGRGDIRFSIAATDVVDDPDARIDEVVVTISKLVFVSEAGDRETIELDPVRQVNLLQFTRGDSAALLATTLPSARYASVELTIESDEGNFDSYVGYESSGDNAVLYVPDAEQAKLKVPIDFEIEDGEVTALTLQFELRKSLRRKNLARYELHPNLRLVDDALIGTISGEVDTALVPAGCNSAIYAFSGSNAEASDIGAGGADPVMTAAVFRNDDRTGLVYSLEFLGAGNYTLALTCEAGDEDPTTDDGLEFGSLSNVTVESGTTTVRNIGR